MLDVSYGFIRVVSDTIRLFDNNVNNNKVPPMCNVLILADLRSE